MYIKGYKAIHTVKPATKEHQKKNMENYLFQPTFWFKCKNVKTNVRKLFLQLRETHFPSENK